MVTGGPALTAERDSVRFGATTIEYEVRRSPRRHKTVQITVDGGGVEVIAPSATPGPEVRAIVAKRAAWILARLAEVGGAAGAAGLVSSPVPTPRRFVSGETLPYLGRNVRLIVEPAPAGTRSPEVRFDHWSFRIAVPPGLDDFNAVTGGGVSGGGPGRVRASGGGPGGVGVSGDSAGDVGGGGAGGGPGGVGVSGSDAGGVAGGVGVGGDAGGVGGAGEGDERRERIRRAVVK